MGKWLFSSLNELRFGTESTIFGIKLVSKWTMFSSFKDEMLGLDMQRVCTDWWCIKCWRTKVINEVHVEKGSTQSSSLAVKVTLETCKIFKDGSKRDGGSF